MGLNIRDRIDGHLVRFDNASERGTNPNICDEYMVRPSGQAVTIAKIILHRNTDYILINARDVHSAITALTNDGWTFID